MTTVLGTANGGGAASATSTTVTLPAGFATAGRILLVVTRGAAWTVAQQVASAGVVLTEITLPSVDWARIFWVTNPAATFTLTTAAVSTAWGWGCVTLSDCQFDVVDSGIATSTATPITFKTPTAGATADLALGIAAVNASAVWTATTGGTAQVVRNTAVGAFIMSNPISGGVVTPMSVDRGNTGINRRMTWITLTVKPTAVAASGRPQTWLAGSWQKKPGKVWTGSAWVEKPMKRHNGTAWVPIS